MSADIVVKIVHIIAHPANQDAAQGAAEALAKQQLTTAWIQAGAAIVQAVGSVGAIWASVWIARTADKRASAAEAAADRRAKAADDEAQRRITLAETLATARAERAEQTADYRAQLERDKPHNDLVTLIVSRVDEVIDEVEAQIAEFRALPEGRVYGAGFGGIRRQRIVVDLDDWREHTHDPVLLGAIDALRATVIDPGFRDAPAQEIVAKLETLLAPVRAQRDVIHAMLKTPPPRPFTTA